MSDVEDLRARVRDLWINLARRRPVARPASLPPQGSGLDARDGLREDAGMISGGAAGRGNDSTYTAYVMGMDGWTIYRALVLGEGPSARFNHLIGLRQTGGHNYFLPSVVNADPAAQTHPEIYPVGFTLEQLFELEWAAESVSADSSVSSSDGSASTTTTVANLYGTYGGVGQSRDPSSIPDERYLLRRGGLRQTFVGASFVYNDGTEDRTTFIEIDLCIGAQTMTGALPVSQWYDPAVGFYTDPGARQNLIGGDTGVSGPRICFWDDLYYPAMFVGFRAVIDVPSTGGGQIVAGTSDLPGVGIGAASSAITLYGIDDLWSIDIPIDTVDVGGFAYSVTGGVELHLESWDFV